MGTRWRMMWSCTEFQQVLPLFYAFLTTSVHEISKECANVGNFHILALWWCCFKLFPSASKTGHLFIAVYVQNVETVYIVTFSFFEIMSLSKHKPLLFYSKLPQKDKTSYCKFGMPSCFFFLAFPYIWFWTEPVCFLRQLVSILAILTVCLYMSCCRI